MKRWIAPATLLAAVLAAVPAHANHKAPITGAYQALAPVTSACRAGVPGGEHRHEVRLPERGRLEVELAGRGFDMDLELLSDTGIAVAKSHRPGAAEKFVYRVRKPGKYEIRVCNYIAGPLGDVTFVFTFD